MSARIYPIHHNGKEVIYTDWRDLIDENEFKNAIWETSNWVIERNQKELLEIVDIRGAYFNLDIFSELKKAAAATRKYNFKKAVVADFSDSRLLMLRFLNNFSQDKITPFRNLEDAKDWVTGE